MTLVSGVHGNYPQILMPKVFIPERSKWIGAAKLFDGFSVYTDGSKIETVTSSGVYR